MDDTFSMPISLDISAPRSEVWAALTTPASLAKWWGPEGFRNTINEMEVRVGGRLDIVMHGPDGTDYHNTYVFDEVEAPSSLSYTHLPNEAFGLGASQAVVNLTDAGGRTTINWQMRFPSQAEMDKHLNQFHADEGARQLLARLGQLVAGTRSE